MVGPFPRFSTLDDTIYADRKRACSRNTYSVNGRRMLPSPLWLSVGPRLGGIAIAIAIAMLRLENSELNDSLSSVSLMADFPNGRDKLSLVV